MVERQAVRGDKMGVGHGKRCETVVIHVLAEKVGYRDFEIEFSETAFDSDFPQTHDADENGVRRVLDSGGNGFTHLRIVSHVP